MTRAGSAFFPRGKKPQTNKKRFLCYCCSTCQWSSDIHQDLCTTPPGFERKEKLMETCCFKFAMWVFPSSWEETISTNQNHWQLQYFLEVPHRRWSPPGHTGSCCSLSYTASQCCEPDLGWLYLTEAGLSFCILNIPALILFCTLAENTSWLLCYLI